MPQLDLGSIDARHATGYNFSVIRSSRHRGLKALYEGRTPARVNPEHIAKLRRILILLDRSNRPEGMDLPGLRLHRLKGELRGSWAVSVTGNWRVWFRFEDGDAVEVDYGDYH